MFFGFGNKSKNDIIYSLGALLSWSIPSEMYISTGNEIIQLQASTGDNLTTRVLFNGLDEVEDLDVDRDHNIIYWVDTVLKSINRASVLNDNISRTGDYETVGLLMRRICIIMLQLIYF